MAVTQQPSSAVSADLVYTDDLTGLRNRRFLYQVFGEGWSEVSDSESELSLAIVDLDYFKQVNDTHGHLTGDLVLAETASLIQEFLAEEDHAVRYGGDEFVLLLPRRSKAESRDFVERLRCAMAEREFVSKEENQPLEVVLSFSIGVATFPQDGSTGEELMAAADKALYASKKAGRNCVTVSGELPAGLEDEIDKYRTFPCKTLVGRQEILDTLAGLCELVNLGTGTWTALAGPAGIGKTRLLHEALRLGLDSSIACVLICLSEDQAAQPYSGIANLLSEIVLRYPKVFGELAEDAPPGLLTFLKAHAPELVASSIDLDEDSASHSPETLYDTLLETSKKLCGQKKWLFLLDDVGFLDPHSAELLRVLLETEKLPLGVVSAHRNTEPDLEPQPGLAFLESLNRKPWFDHLEVEPLSREAMEVLVSVLLPNHHAPSEFSSHLYDTTAGNPLFIEELLRLGIARETITRRGGEWFVQFIDRRNQPATLEEAIGQRMSVLDAETGQGISRAAAMGTSLTPEVLRALLGKNEGEVLAFLDKARNQGFVEGGQRGDLSQIRFASTIFREQAYEQMTDADRTRAHREIGKIEEHRAGSLVGVLSSRLAYHFERGEAVEKARAYLEAAQLSAPPIVVAGSWDATEVPKHRRRRITGAAIPLPEEAWPSLDNAVRAIAQASKALWMYPEGSPIADTAFNELHAQLGSVLEYGEVISLAAIEGTLVVNGIPYPANRQEFLVRGLLDQFKAREIRGFTIREGITERETGFLISQLASDEPVERDPEAWEALLAKEGIENVDFGDRVYVPAEGVANAPLVPSETQLLRSGVIRVGSASELQEMVQDPVAADSAEEHLADVDGASPSADLSVRDLQSLLEGFEADTVIDTEIEALVPIVAELLKKLLASADDMTRLEHHMLVEAIDSESEAARAEDDLTEGEDDYLRLIRTERDPASKQNLLHPAEERFDAFLQAKDFKSARSVLRFIRQCQSFAQGEGDLAEEGQETLEHITTGGTAQLLLEDILAAPENPDQDALDLLREIGADCASVLVTFLQETDDLRSRRMVAKLLKEIGGEPHHMALASITYGDNPVVARRVIGVLDCLSMNLISDLSRAVIVRNPGVLGEAVKILQRQPRTIQIQVIGSLLESASPELVCRGVYYLSEWNLEEAKAKVLSLLRESEDFEILAAVTAAIARWRLPEAVPILGELLGRKQVMRLVPVLPRGLRREFARALAAIGTQEAKSVLAKFTKDVDAEVRNIARGMPTPSGA